MNKFLTGLAACLLLASSLACAGEWVEDQISGCAIWNDEPSDGGDVVSWSGECGDGKATGFGVLSWFADGGLLVRYAGALRAGRVDGVGTLIIRAEQGDGYDHFEAEFVDGEFDGEFVDGKMQGWGSWRSADGSRFEGQFGDGRPNGQGIYRAPNGDIFNGSFVDGMADGEISVTTGPLGLRI